MAATRTRKNAATKPATTVVQEDTMPTTTAPAAPAETISTKVEDGESTKAKDFTYLADKEPTDLHRNFQTWLEAQTGVKVDLKTLQMVCVTRMDFQRSEANQTHLVARKASKAEREAAKAAEKKAKLIEQAKAMGLEIKA